MTASVALCTFNGENFLNEQLDSILSQEIPVNEIVVCDDGSTDRTSSILKEYQIKFPEIFRIFFNAENLGYVRNFEYALSLCTSDIIFLCDQDDVWNKNKTAVISNYFEKNPQIGIVAHNLELIGSYKGNQTFWDLKNFGLNEKKYTSQELLKHILVEGNIFPGMSLAIRKELLHQYLPLQKVNSIVIHDYELLIKALRDQKFAIVDEILGGYRQHDGQTIGYKEKETIPNDELAEIHLLSQHYLRIKDYIEIFNLDKKIGDELREKIKEKYSVFLRKFPIIKRIFIHMKNKYYYKIIHF